MLDRTIVCRVAPPLLVKRQYENWRRYPNPKRTPGYQWPCWVCGELGVLGADGFGARGFLVRPRNIMHSECFETLTTEQRRVYRHRDVRHLMYRKQRRIAKRHLDRESLRRRRWEQNHV